MEKLQTEIKPVEKELTEDEKILKQLTEIMGCSKDKLIETTEKVAPIITNAIKLIKWFDGKGVTISCEKQSVVERCNAIIAALDMSVFDYGRTIDERQSEGPKMKPIVVSEEEFEKMNKEAGEHSDLVKESDAFEIAHKGPQDGCSGCGMMFTLKSYIKRLWGRL